MNKTQSTGQISASTSKVEDIQLVSLVIPMYNEEKCIPSLVKRLVPIIAKIEERWPVQLVLVNDGSSDNTQQLLSANFNHLPIHQVMILQHEKNKGIGAAMATAFNHAKGDIVCTLDCDCTYAPEHLPTLIDLLIEYNGDIITGSPYHPEGSVQNVALKRLMLSKTASRMYRMLIPKKLYCYTSFFRAYRRKWANKCFFSSNDFLAVTEILISAAYRGARIIEYPIELGSRETGGSSMRVTRVIMHHLNLMGRAALFNAGMGMNQIGLIKADELKGSHQQRSKKLEHLERSDWAPILNQWTQVDQAQDQDSAD